MSTRIVAIDGLGGRERACSPSIWPGSSGVRRFLHTDDFASWENPLSWWPRLIEEALEPLARNRPGRYRRPDWGSEDHDEWGQVLPAAVVILEGVSACRAAFRPFLTYSIWIETPRKIRLSRGLERDGEQARAQWEQWMAAEDDYVRREKPQEQADLVLPGDRDLWVE
jgi:uridine kinase